MRREEAHPHAVYEGYFDAWSQEYLDEWEIVDCQACLMTLNFGDNFIRLRCDHILHINCCVQLEN